MHWKPRARRRRGGAPGFVCRAQGSAGLLGLWLCPPLCRRHIVDTNRQAHIGDHARQLLRHRQRRVDLRQRDLLIRVRLQALLLDVVDGAVGCLMPHAHTKIVAGHAAAHPGDYRGDMSGWISIVVSVVSGSIGGLAMASWTTQRQERGRDSYRAREALRVELRRYRHQLTYDNAAPSRSGAYPETYASTESAERLAEAVLRQLPMLGRRRRKLRADLVELVGEDVVNLADERTYLPEESRDAEWERRRLDVAERHLRFDEDAANGSGLLGVLRRTQNDPPQHHEHFVAAMAVLQRMEKRVSSRVVSVRVASV